MRKNFLLTVASTVAAVFAGTMVAQAASVEWGGQLRPRAEYNEQAGFNQLPTGDDGQRDGDYFVSSRIRLHAKADILPDTSAFIQLQSVRTWGNQLDSSAGSFAGSGNAAFTASDADASVGVHQAYFTLKNFATIPVDVKIGRQEVVLDGHRIIGNTGWTQGAQTHDAVTLTHKLGNHTLAYVYSMANDDGKNGTTNGANDNTNVEAHVVYANFQGILGGGLSLYFVSLNDGCGFGDTVSGATTTTNCNSTAASPLDNNIYTFGLRQAGQLYGIDYRAEYYYQTGDAEGDAANFNNRAISATSPYTAAGLKGTDRSAYMIGARVGKTFNNVMWKPSVTLWYDYLSGTSDEDARDGEFNTFNTLFDTGHKFYGYMDILGLNGGQTANLGLVDYAVKTSISPAKNWKFKADWHYFTTAEGIGANSRMSSTSGTNSTGDDGNKLGNELDLTLVHKYNANTTISAGWSHFWQEQGFEVVNTSASSTLNPSTADWAYLQFDVKF